MPENYFRRVALLGLVGNGYEADQMAAAGECGDRLQSAEDYGRDVHCWTPPAQIRTCPI